MDRNRPSVPKIVYHGTFSEYPPHEYEQGTFHAGTIEATEQRLEDEMGHGVDIPDMPVWSVHKYEISEGAPMSRRTWSDPIIGISRHNYEGAPPPVPEHGTNRIYPYTNIREDRGSTSYVIPSNFVGGHVKYLGTQFRGMVGYQGEAIVDAAKAMLGVPRKRK